MSGLTHHQQWPPLQAKCFCEELPYRASSDSVLRHINKYLQEYWCNEGQYHCLHWWSGCMTGNSVRSEAGNKVWPLPYSPRVHKLSSHGLNNVLLNHLTPNGHYMGRTAQLTSTCCILYIYSTNIRIEYFELPWKFYEYITSLWAPSLRSEKRLQLSSCPYVLTLVLASIILVVFS